MAASLTQHIGPTKVFNSDVTILARETYHVYGRKVVKSNDVVKGVFKSNGINSSMTGILYCSSLDFLDTEEERSDKFLLHLLGYLSSSCYY